MKRKTRGKNGRISPLFFQILTWSTLFCVMLLSITLSLTLHLAISGMEEKIDEGLFATASALAESGLVARAMEEGSCDRDMVEYLDDLVRNTADLDVITIADKDSIRLYHVVHDRIGQPFVGDDQFRALAGESYLSDAVGTMGLQRRAFSPIRDDEGNILGFVMAGTTIDRIKDMRSSITMSYRRLTIVMGVVTVLAAGLLTLLVRWILHGFSPEGLVHTYLTQNDILDNLDQGLVAVDDRGRILMVNPAAERMLGASGDELEGRELDGLLRTEDQKTLLTPTRDAVTTSQPNILSRCIPVRREGKHTGGATLILTDKTEAVRQAEQLTGTRHIISALRASTHEFMNKLQVISGLIQMGRQEEALSYIGAISATQAKSAGPILQHIKNSNVAALLLGKLNNLRELGIEFTLLPNSVLPEHSAYLSTRDLVTVLGNLLENAMEAVNLKRTPGPRNVVLQITEDDLGLMLMVSDTGSGIAEDDLQRIYTQGFSTKAPEGRGMGMTLVREVVYRRGGSIEVDTEQDNGTTFTVIFDQKRREAYDPHDPS